MNIRVYYLFYHDLGKINVANKSRLILGIRIDK